MPPMPPTEGLATLAALLSSQVRARLLLHVVTHLDQPFSLTEIARALGIALSSAQHECYKLQEIGVLRRELGTRRYALDLHLPLAAGVTRIVVSAVGLPHAVETALRDLPGLDAATLLGDVPATIGTTALVLIGELSLETVEIAQRRVAWLLECDPDAIEIAFFRPEAWLAHRDAGHPLVRRLLDLPVRLAFGEVRPG